MDGFIEVGASLKTKTSPTRTAPSTRPAIATMDGEFILNDLIAAERRLES